MPHKIWIALTLSFLLYATAARDGHDWGGDYAQYVLHAQAVLQGEPYAPPPGYIHNPYQNWIPIAYPPLYSLLITPILAVLGLHFVGIKVLTSAVFILGFIFFYRLSRTRLSPQAAWGALLFLLLSPYLLKFSNKILSDLPYVAISMLTLWAGHLYFEHRPNWRNVLLFSVALTCALCTRNVGLALVVAIPAYTLFFKRTHILTSAFITAIGLGAMWAVSRSMIAFSVDEVGVTPWRMLIWLKDNLISGFPYQLSRYLAIHPKATGHLDWIINKPLFIVFITMALIGVVHTLKTRNIKYWDIYAYLYAGMILSYGWVVIRYLLPLIPLLTIYAYQGLRITTYGLYRYVTQKHFKRFFVPFFRHRFLLPPLIYCPLFLVYWGHYTLNPVTPGANILKDPDIKALFDEVEHHAQNYTGAIFHRPRVLTLFTGVAATTCFNNTLRYYPTELTWDFAKLIDLAEKGNISHIILDSTGSATTRDIGQIVETHPEHFLHTYHNPKFDIYRVSLSQKD